MWSGPFFSTVSGSSGGFATGGPCAATGRVPSAPAVADLPENGVAAVPNWHAKVVPGNYSKIVATNPTQILDMISLLARQLPSLVDEGGFG